MAQIKTKFVTDNAITNAKLAQMATLTLKGNNTGGTANALDLTVSQVNTMLGDLLANGSVALTSSWNAGAFTITANSVQVGSAANTIAGLSTLTNGSGHVTLNTTGTVTIPGVTDTLTANAATQTLTNKSLVDNSTFFINHSDNTKEVLFDISGVSSGQTRTWAYPDTSDTFVGITSVQTLSNKFFDTTDQFSDTTTPSKRLNIDLSGSTASTTLTLAAAQTGNITITLPTSATTLVGRNTTDTLTNKTLLDGSTLFANTSDATKKVAFSLSSITTATTRTWTFPDATDTFVGATNTQRLSNKSLDTTTTSFSDTSVNTKSLKVDTSGATASTTLTLAAVQTGNITVTLPSAATTLVGRDTTDTLTNKTLTGNTAVNLVSGSGTFTLNTTGTITVPNATDTLVGKATTDTLTNKTLTGNTAVNLVSGSGTLTLNTTGTITIPNATDTLVGKATTDTLTNKTLTAPVVSNYEDYTEISTPSAPAASTMRLYAKSDDNFYVQNHAGTESQIATSASSVTLTGVQTLSNKTLVDNTTYIEYNVTPSATVQFDVSTVPASTNVVYQFPYTSGVSSDVFVTTKSIQTLSGEKITQNASSGSLTVTTGNSIYRPQMTVASSHTYTINSGAFLYSVGKLTINGTVTMNGTSSVIPF